MNSKRFENIVIGISIIITITCIICSILLFAKMSKLIYDDGDKSSIISILYVISIFIMIFSIFGLKIVFGITYCLVLLLGIMFGDMIEGISKSIGFNYKNLAKRLKYIRNGHKHKRKETR